MLEDEGPLPPGVSEILVPKLESMLSSKGGPLIYLHRDVEYYEWMENVKEKTKKKAGGGTTTTKSYSYTEDWTSSHHDSSKFKKPDGHQNMKPAYEDKTFKTPDTVILMEYTPDSPKLNWLNYSQDNETQRLWLDSDLVNELISKRLGN